MKENIAKLLKVKTLVTMVVIAVFAVLSLTDRISEDQVMLIVATVVSFYFGSVAEKKNNDNGETT